MEKIEGSVAGTMYRNPENGYTVMSIRSKGRLITVVGSMPEMMDGEQAAFLGTWTSHPQYGKQFKASSLEVQAPRSMGAIEKYLGSGLIRGLGPSTARTIVATFGVDTLKVLSSQPERLMEVPKIGKKRMDQIAAGFMAQQASRATYFFLQRYGIPPALSAKINKLYRENAEALIRENPYRLIDDIDGVGFLTADRIAQSLGIAPHSDFRLRAGIKFCLQDAAGSGGHTCLPLQELLHQASQMLVSPEQEVERQLSELLLQKELFADTIGGTKYISLPRMRRAESDAARRLLALSTASQLFMPGHVKRAISAFEQDRQIRFSKTQRDAILLATQEGLCVITGGPGTGKTTLINCILSILGENSKVLLAAPTGRAAKRLGEACGREASTLHRLLQYGGEDGSFQINQENPLDCDCLIVDEVSMMDIFLMNSLLRALQMGTRLILVGDADQLPSVGPGNVLFDILNAPTIQKVRLNEIFRQSEDSMIVQNAHLINQGKAPKLNRPGSDFFFEHQADAELASASIVKLALNRLPAFLDVDEPSRSIQVLSPTRKGVCGVSALNARLQEAFNPREEGKQELKFSDSTFRNGDKVMHIKNNYALEWEQPDGSSGQGIFNGDIGYITMVDEEDQLLKVLYDEDRSVVYDYALLEELELAYCLSVHKSQGSEFPAVIMPMVGGPKVLLTRNLLYTGITRAKQLVVLVGRQEVLQMMIDNNLERRRYAALGYWLEQIPKRYDLDE